MCVCACVRACVCILAISDNYILFLFRNGYMVFESIVSDTIADMKFDLSRL